VLLHDGTVLVAGGATGAGATASAERYNPLNGSWVATGPMSAARSGHTATLLSNGTVLIARGVASAELYDPMLGRWSATARPALGGIGATATLMPDGRVLVAGGDPGTGASAAAEIYEAVEVVETVTGTGEPDAVGLVGDLKASMTGLVGGSFSFQVGHAQDFLIERHTPEACASLDGFSDRVAWHSGRRLERTRATDALERAAQINVLIHCG